MGSGAGPHSVAARAARVPRPSADGDGPHLEGRPVCHTYVTSPKSALPSHNPMLTSHNLIFTSYDPVFTRHKPVFTSHRSVINSHRHALGLYLSLAWYSRSHSHVLLTWAPTLTLVLSCLGLSLSLSLSLYLSFLSRLSHSLDWNSVLVGVLTLWHVFWKTGATALGLSRTL